MTQTPPPKPLLIDATLFHEELDMLDFRLRVLWHCVDKFVVVESDHQFSGKPKPYHIAASLGRFDWAADKLVYVEHKASTKGLVLDEPPCEYDPSHDCWKLEYQQRGAVADALARFPKDSIVMISDIDEIPSRPAIEAALLHPEHFPAVFQQAFFYYNLSNLRAESWNGTVISSAGHAVKEGCQALRNRRHDMQPLMYGGWHLSYFGDTAAIQRKIAAFSHQELNTPEFRDSAHIEACLTNGADLFRRPVGRYKVGKGFFPGYFIAEVTINEWWGK